MFSEPSKYDALRALTIEFAASFSSTDPTILLDNFFHPVSCYIIEHGPSFAADTELPFLGHWSGRGLDQDSLDSYMSTLSRVLMAREGGIQEASITVDDRLYRTFASGRTKWEVVGTKQSFWETWAWCIEWVQVQNEGRNGGKTMQWVSIEQDEDHRRYQGHKPGKRTWALQWTDKPERKDQESWKIRTWRVWADPLSAWLAVRNKLEKVEFAVGQETGKEKIL